MSDSRIKVEVNISAPAEVVWKKWTLPDHITKWNFAADTWHCPSAVNDLREGGRLNWRMEARDGSMGFDFTGAYTKVEPPELLEYMLDDGRNVRIEFKELPGATRVTEFFEPETMNPEEMQKTGWQAILDNFKRYVEQHA